MFHCNSRRIWIRLHSSWSHCSKEKEGHTGVIQTKFLPCLSMQFFSQFSFIFYNKLLISNLRIGGGDKLFVQNFILVDLGNTIQYVFGFFTSWNDDTIYFSILYLKIEQCVWKTMLNKSRCFEPNENHCNVEITLTQPLGKYSLMRLRIARNQCYCYVVEIRQFYSDLLLLDLGEIWKLKSRHQATCQMQCLLYYHFIIHKRNHLQEL